MKLYKIALFSIAIIFSVNAFALNLKEKTSESFAYYYYQKKNYKRAIEEYKNIIKENPRNLKARYNLACLYVLTKDYSSSIKEFKKIIKVQSPLKKDALYNLSVIYGKYLKDKKSASQYYARFKKMQK
jgi:tetratricopeptide (TPR) repeat protein